ncbi:MAG: valine--tRNA ligase [Syntrophomonadaceae bacterium]|nr:valine--tRNA ligase [Syntrophomonadaceae bacterium]
MNNLPKTYNPSTVEKKWYDYWLEKGYFAPSEDLTREPFSIVMPPPNVTGMLHMGHALDNTLQDILTRWRRMQGYSVLWLPGTDHAGIATQARVEESLAQQGISRHDLGREAFLEKVWEWKHIYGSTITNQLKMLGASCDWSRERFTMDEGCSRAVREVFVRLFEKGLIYRGDYIINWCPRCHTTISDIEVEHIESEGKLYYIKYPLQDGEGYLTVATTRPETMLGDTGVAVNPADERYRDYIGKNLILPILGRVIPVVADDYVDREFGTGAVKVTPAHDPNDFEMGLRHNLPPVNVINQDGTMSDEAGPYRGLDRYECRRRIVEDLREQGYLLKVEDHTHAVGHCYRCNTVIEPMISKQWFVKMKPLAEPAMKRVLDGDIVFVPGRFTKIYINWLENIRDWCISRQLWWGHRIPVWYCECGEMICSREDPEVCPRCNSSALTQDPDVLDTWFSSALWPFSTMGWPEDTRDLARFYPTSVLVTGRDIIFFWVARMIFAGLEFMKEVPFHDVMIHGLILDGQGRKMSKSLGNGIDPIEVIEQYGADTLRFSLITGTTPGNDVRFYMDKVENTRNFANKVWNASRFVIMNMEDYERIELADSDFELADRWILHRLSVTNREVTRLLEQYELGEAARTLYDFIWDDFCDWYVELAKPRLYRPEKPRERKVAQNILLMVLKDTLKMLHPFMPFITEEIFQHLPEATESIMIEPWPENDRFYMPQAEEDMRLLIQIIRAIRNIRNEFNIPPGMLIPVQIVTPDTEKAAKILKNRSYIENMANLKGINVTGPQETRPVQALSAYLVDIEILVPVEGVIDVEKEIARLEKELHKTEQDIKRLESKLNNQGFISKAPAEVVEKEKARQKENLEKREGIIKRLQTLKG